MAVAKTSEPPYYAVIFTSTRTEGDNGYSEIAEAVVKLAEMQPGFLGAESVRNAEKVGITVSYWDSLESIQKFKAVAKHVEAQKRSKEWYSEFGLRVCMVEKDKFLRQPCA